MFSVFDRQRPQAEWKITLLIAVVRHAKAAVAVAGTICLGAVAIDIIFGCHEYKIKMKN